MSKCPKCGKDFELSKQDKALRNLIGINAMLFPALKEVCNQTKEYCNPCWKIEMQPSAEAILKEVSTIEPSNEGKVRS